MPKPLRQPPPSSSVARLLDVEAATRALAPSKPAATSAPQQTPLVSSSPPAEQPTPSNVVSPQFPLNQRTGEPANLKRELVLSPSTDQAFERLVELYRRATGTRLSNSHVARAVLKGVSACFLALEREAETIGQLKLPGNARGREGERERFEERIAEAFVNGVRSAAAYRRRHP